MPSRNVSRSLPFALFLVLVLVCSGPHPGFAAPDLQYRPEDLDFRLDQAARVIGDADVEAVLAKLLGKNAFLIPLLKLDRPDRRETVRRLLQIEATVRAIDLKDLGTLETALRLDAFTDLWKSLQELRGRTASDAELERLKRAVETYGTLVDLSRRFGSTTRRGRYAFLLAMARDELARRVKDPEKARMLKALVREDLLEALASFGSRGGKDDTGEEQEQTVSRADVEEKLKTLDDGFGGLMPLAAPAGRSVTLTSDIGMRRHPKTGRLRRHNGIDLAGTGCDGWNVAAIGPGRVVRSDWAGGYGYLVVLRHDLDSGVYYSRYGHLRREARAVPGTIVGRGDRIGLCNNSGVSTGSHLHFEVRERGETGAPVDPKPLLTRPMAAAGHE